MTDKSEVANLTVLKNAATFTMWSFQIKILFEAKDLLKFVDGTVTLDEVPVDQHDDWREEDAKAKLYIMMTTEKSVKQHLLSCSTSKEMYDKLKKIYEKDTEHQKCHLLQELYSYKWNRNKSCLDNVSTIQQLSFQLNSLGHVINDNAVLTKVSSMLPKEFSNFATAWDSVPLAEKTIDNLCSRLQLEESKMLASKEEIAETVAFQAGGSNSVKDRLTCKICKKQGHAATDCKIKRKCKYCKRNNHPSERCFYKPKPCAICKKTNHKQENCYYNPERVSPKRKDNPSNYKNNEKRFKTETESGEKHKQKKQCFMSFNKRSKDSGAESSGSQVSETSLVVDSGATGHMTNDINLLSNIKHSESNIQTAEKGASMKSSYSGDLESETCILNQVNYVPGLTKNLLSVSRTTKGDASVIFTEDHVYVCRGQALVSEESIILKGERISELYYIDLKCIKNKQVFLCQSDLDIFISWHRKMGHLGPHNLYKLQNMCTGVRFQISPKDLELICTVCAEANSIKLPHNTVRERAKKPLELLHIDLSGKISPATHNNRNYYLLILDDYTHFIKVFLLTHKSQSADFIKQFVAESQRQLDTKVKKIRCDNGGEFICNNLKDWCEKKGIILDYTIPYCPQLNGKAERMNKTLGRRVRALLNDSELPQYMWGEAVYTAAYLINRSPTSTVSKLPIEMWTQKPQDLSNIELFGTIAYAKINEYLKKLDNRAKESVFVGYCPNGYRLWDPLKRRIFVSRDVIFTDISGHTLMNRDHKEHSITIKTKKSNKKGRNRQNRANDETHEHEHELDNPDEVENQEEQNPGGNEQEQNLEEENGDNCIIENPGYNLRDRNTITHPKKFDDYKLYLISQEPLPLTYETCATDPNWKKAIEDEKHALKKNEAWTLVDRNQAQGKEIITSRWIFKIKEDGRYRARLVARGCQQKEKLEIEEKYSPVVDTTNLRMLFAIAAQSNMKIKVFDVKTAFLNGSLDQEVYMRVPQGYTETNKVCLLKKALYGLKQAPLRWYKRLTTFLRNEDFTQLMSDRCIFKSTDNSIYIAIHVDDGIIVGKDLKAIQKIINKLEQTFEVTVNHNPKTYLGMEITKTDDGLTLTQITYAKKVLEKYGMENCRPVDTPIELKKNKKIPNFNTKAKDRPKLPYREIVGSLQHLACKTRPDLAFAVNYVNRSVENPTNEDKNNVIRILKYLKGHIELGIHYSSEDHILAFSDSDYGGSGPKGKMMSTTGYVLTYAKGPVAWCSRKQNIVALSTAEAEYVAAAECCKEIQYISTLYKELTDNTAKVTLHVDNQSAIKMIKTGQMNRRTKHINIRFYYISVAYDEKLFSITYCPTGDQIADILTKALLANKFSKFRDLLTKKVL